MFSFPVCLSYCLFVSLSFSLFLYMDGHSVTMTQTNTSPSCYCLHWHSVVLLSVRHSSVHPSVRPSVHPPVHHPCGPVSPYICFCSPAVSLLLSISVSLCNRLHAPIDERTIAPPPNPFGDDSILSLPSEDRRVNTRPQLYASATTR